MQSSFEDWTENPHLFSKSDPKIVLVCINKAKKGRPAHRPLFSQLAFRKLLPFKIGLHLTIVPNDLINVDLHHDYNTSCGQHYQHLNAGDVCIRECEIHDKIMLFFEVLLNGRERDGCRLWPEGTIPLFREDGWHIMWVVYFEVYRNRNPTRNPMKCSQPTKDEPASSRTELTLTVVSKQW